MERNTQQRKAIVNVIDAEQRPLSVQEILDLATHECPGLGIATVYRNVRA
ncbi:MAG: transcriptional repressor, partial [Candidatus Obscuribacter sp.]|nr:transcriptional repressor [Candidatus Obscuribacter sp.]